MSVRSRRALRPAALVATLAACVAAALVPSTAAFGDASTTKSSTEVAASRTTTTRTTTSEPSSVHVRGNLILVDEKKMIYKVTGDLRGYWVIPPEFTENYFATDSTFIQKGEVEYFIGCLGPKRRQVCGHFDTDYISWTYLNRKATRLIDGGCVHPIKGGSRAFTGLRGLLVMDDSPDGRGGITTTYEGDLILGAVPEEGPRPAPALTLVSAQKATARAASSAGC